MTPDFSPSMLKSFLRIRVAAMAQISFPSVGRSAEKSAKAELRKHSGLSREDFELAYSGRLSDPESRTRIWKALWIDPALYGVRLTDGGQEASDGA